jgi:PAS domain S-box-containing protein
LANQFKRDMPDTADRTRAGRHVDAVEQQGGLFVEAVHRTRMPMLVTDSTLPGNPITFANPAFIALSGYTFEELLGQDPHFMNGAGTDPDAIARYTLAMHERQEATLEIVQYRKDGSAFRAMLFASPIDDGQGTVASHFLSYLDITQRWQAEEDVRVMTAELEARVAARTAELQEANARLTQLVAERDVLMIEVNHRAKNSLAVAAGLLTVQARRQADPAVRAQFDAARERLHAMAKLHDLLSRSEAGQRVDLATYLAQLCDALGGSGDHPGVTVRSQADHGIFLEPDTAFPIGIILTELVTNALKYAFPLGRTGVVLAQARRAAGGRVELLVRDDGVGMGELRDGSLGFGLVRSLVKQIRGDITVESAPGVAARISSQNTPSRPGAGRAAPARKATKVPVTPPAPRPSMAV